MGLWRRIRDAESSDGEWVGTDVSERFPIYTRGNAGEVYPEVFSPLSFSVSSASGEQAMRNAILSSGVIRPNELDGVPLSTAIGSGVFGGYAYLNLSLQRVAASRMPGGSTDDVDEGFLGFSEAPPHMPSKADRNLRGSLAGIRWVWRTLRTTELPHLESDKHRVEQYLATLPVAKASTDQQLADASRVQLDDLFMDLFETHLKVSSAAGAMMAVLMSLCEKQLGDRSLAVRLVSGLGDIESAAPSLELWSLGRLVRGSGHLTEAFDAGVDGLETRLPEAVSKHADVQEFVAAFEAFISKFGSRGPNEWDTAFDTWETDPALALTLVDRMRGAHDDHDPSAQQNRLAGEREVLEADVLKRIKRPLRGLFRRSLAASRLYAQSRERSKTTVVRAIHGARLQAHELDRRLAEQAGGARGDLWFVVQDELDAYVQDPASFAELITQRREMHRRLAERIPPFVFDTVMPPLDEWELRDQPMGSVVAGEVITGLSGCAGVARGRARVVTDPGDPRGIEPGDVLVAPLTDPSWTPLFVPVEAVVVDVGAVMSHAVIVSRELGIPCVVSATDATRRIPDGALVEVDGAAGTVTIVQLPD